MEVVQGSEGSYVPVSLSHRGSGLSFIDLARGTDGTPENFYFSLAKQLDFYSPIHHHNFDQFRYAYKGDITLGEGDSMLLREGQLSYHPEAAWYGPQSDPPGEEKIVLVLQFGGASGQGYLSWGQLKTANNELAEKGTFEKGKYTDSDGNVKDGFQALWEHMNKKKLVYPEARYNAPVIMTPEAFAWKRYGNEQAAYRKTLGVFSEREVRAEMLKVEDDGALELGGKDEIHLLFVLKGQGEVNGQKLQLETAVHLKPGTEADFYCTGETLEMLHFVLPLLDQQS